MRFKRERLQDCHAPSAVDAWHLQTHVALMPKNEKHDVELLKTWTLTTSATMGSSVRAKGILQEMQARLPAALKKSLLLDGSDIILAMPASDKTAFNAAAAI
ncbi:MAG: hypothetical protein KGI75_21375, partial [Rhizobiaceae bacterium]|nr:hypothetical protein [Rhizobiaceae bacterium]